MHWEVKGGFTRVHAEQVQGEEETEEDEEPEGAGGGAREEADWFPTREVRDRCTGLRLRDRTSWSWRAAEFIESSEEEERPFLASCRECW